MPNDDLARSATGLRSHARDIDLCARLGDEDLGLPSPAQVAEAFATRLAAGLELDVERVHLEYARWKPAISALGTWSVTIRGGETRVVTAKRYRGLEKPRALAGRRPANRHLAADLDGVLPFAVDLKRRTAWWTFPSDRALPGLARAVDAPRAARFVQGALTLGELALKKRKARADVVRYRPERRAVVRLEAPRRGAAGSVLVGLRVHPPGDAARIAARRSKCGAAERVGPQLLGHEPSVGVVVEEWLAGALAPGSREDANMEDVAMLLAQLHAAPQEAVGGEPPSVAEKDLSPWFDRVSNLAAAARRVSPAPRRARTCWTHGDVHGEQLWLTPEGPRLLDLDDLAPGDPLDDLADWVADRIRVRGAQASERAKAFLDAYAAAGGTHVEWTTLRPYVARALVRFAASALRRLEVGAEEHARDLVERALEL